MMKRAGVIILSAALFLGAASSAWSWTDTFLSRVAVLALLQTLNANLLAARSATFTLDRWCADHAMAAPPVIRARLMRDVRKEPTPEQRERLKVDATEPVMFRHVELACGDHVLSEADNWYVPSRLSPEMNRLLETTDTAFGRAVAELKPFRQTFAARLLWQPLPDGWERGASRPPEQFDHELMMPRDVIEHRALLFTSQQVPFAEVDEVYRDEVLAFELLR